MSWSRRPTTGAPVRRTAWGRGLTAAVAALALSLAGSLAPASAAGSNDPNAKKKAVDHQVSAARDDLDASSRAMQRAAASLAAARTGLPAAWAQLYAARAELAAARAQQKVVRAKLSAARLREKVVRDQVTEVSARIDATQVLMGRIASDQYQAGGMATLGMVLAADSPSDLIERVVSTQVVLRNQGALANQMAADRQLLVERENRLAEATVAVAQAAAQATALVKRRGAATRQAAAAKAEVERLVRARAAALRVARSQRAAELRRYHRLQAEQQRLQRLIAAQSRGSGIPTGELLWPAAGPLVQGVGPRIHPVYGYKSCHTGIDIGAVAGAPIHAAASGVVVAATWSDVYGWNTLIDHGGGLSTFYAHQSAFAVSAGQRVRAGQVIGYVGGTGWVTGPHLHFEVHVNGVPYDPMGWFGGAKVPVRC